MPARLPVPMPEDHPLYYRSGKEHLVIRRWRAARLGMLFFTVSFLASSAYMAWWFHEHRETYRFRDRIPMSLQFALGVLSLSVAGSVAYQATSFRCPRCRHFAGFDYGPNALTGDLFKREEFYCFNCRARLR